MIKITFSKNSRPRHPQSNGVVEVVHKEIRRYVLLKFSDFNNNFDLKDVILEAINIHNHNIHTSTGFKPCDIINNTNEKKKKKVLDNINKSLKKFSNINDNIKEGDKVLINQFVHHSGKKLVISKFKPKSKLFKLPGTILSNYGGGLLAISIDVDNYEFNIGEEYLIESKLCTIIDKEKYDKLISEFESIKNNKQEKKNKERKFRKVIYPKDK